MEKIAIQGHPTRGKGIIKILESLGGINDKDYLGNDTHCYYYINPKNFINCVPDRHLPQRYKKYSLEEYEQTCNTMKNIAICGHSTRSKDIIRILKSLGSNNVHLYRGDSTNMYYYINDANQIDCDPWECLDAKYKTYSLEEYEQTQNTMENKRTIQISLTTAREWYKQGGDLRKVALQAFTENELQELPKSWEEYCKINPYIIPYEEYCLSFDDKVVSTPVSNYERIKYSNLIPTQKRAEQFFTLNKLLQIRDYYNQGWEPDWDNEMENKFVIMGERGKLVLYVFSFTMCLFAFKTKELRDEFFKNFKAELEKIKEFL